MQFACWKCGKVIELAPAGRVGSRDTCPKCDADLQAYRNCRFHDPSKHNQCAEPLAEWVRDKNATNYCDYFQPNAVLLASDRPASSPNEAAKKKFDSLFKV